MLFNLAGDKASSSTTQSSLDKIQEKPLLPHVTLGTEILYELFFCVAVSRSVLLPVLLPPFLTYSQMPPVALYEC